MTWFFIKIASKFKIYIYIYILVLILIRIELKSQIQQENNILWIMAWLFIKTKSKI